MDSVEFLKRLWLAQDGVTRDTRLELPTPEAISSVYSIVLPNGERGIIQCPTANDKWARDLSQDIRELNGFRLPVARREKRMRSKANYSQ